MLTLPNFRLTAPVNSQDLSSVVADSPVWNL